MKMLSARRSPLVACAFLGAAVMVWARPLATMEFATPLLTSCDFSQPSPQSKVVVVGVRKPRSYSTVGIGDEDQSVGVVTLKIEAGTEPLYVIAAAGSPTIWSVSGAIDRVERLVLTGPRDGVRNAPRVAATGITAAKVTTLAIEDSALNEPVRARIARGDNVELWQPALCGPTHGAVLFSKNVISSFLQKRFGRGVDAIAKSDRASLIAIPSGTIEGGSTEPIPYPPVTSDFRQQITAELQQEWPSGGSEIDPKAVVSVLPAVPYRVLPSGAGLLQLVDQKIIEPIGKQNVLVFGLEKTASGALAIGNDPGTVISRPKAYRILQPMRFPPGLDGRWDITFCWPLGLPYPNGHSGSSRVMAELMGWAVMIEGHAGFEKSDACTP